MTVRIPDANGWFEVPANPIAMAGVFPYRGSVIKAPNPDQIYQVFRPPAELGRPETVNSFRLMPFINDHTMLGDPSKTGYVPAEMIGVHGVIGDNVWFNEADLTLYGNVKVFSTSLQKTMDAGKIQLSAGYRCKYIYQPGLFNGQPYEYIQVNILANHLALVDLGRMGPTVAMMDSANDLLVFTMDAKDAVIMAEPLKKRNPKLFAAITAHLAKSAVAMSKRGKAANYSVPTMDAADSDAVASDPSLSDIADILGDVLPQIADINDALAGSGASDAGGGDDDMEPELNADGTPAMDEAGKPKMKKKVPAAAPPPPAVVATTDAKGATGMDAAEIDKLIKAATAPLNAKIAELSSGKPLMSEIASRDALARRAAPFVGTFDCADMTTVDVAKYIAGKKNIPLTPGSEIVSVNAWLHDRPIPRPVFGVAGVGMDSADKAGKTSSVDAYLKGPTK